MSHPLELIRRELLKFEFVQCGMLHEKIQREANGIRPLTNASAEHGFLRFKFCETSVRQKRLGCAHTTARKDLDESLSSLSDYLVDQSLVSKWRKRLKELDLKVIQVDWKKGDAELNHAKLSAELCGLANEDTRLKADLEETDLEIRELVATHGEYVSELEELRKEVLQVIDSLLQGSGKSQTP